jgi:hypothetical protein
MDLGGKYGTAYYRIGSCKWFYSIFCGQTGHRVEEDFEVQQLTGLS